MQYPFRYKYRSIEKVKDPSQVIIPDPLAVRPVLTPVLKKVSKRKPYQPVERKPRRKRVKYERLDPPPMIWFKGFFE